MMSSEMTEPFAAEPLAATPYVVGSKVAPDFDAIYVSLSPHLVRIAVLMVDDRERAVELVHDAFVKAHRRWTVIEDHRAYLRTATVNACRSELRRRQLWRRVMPGQFTRSSSEDQPSELFDVLRALRPRARAIVVLRYWADLSDDQIADTLSIPPGTVKSTLSRTLDRLRNEIER
jgi:RNA polymerase sigma-70 factor (sigma-E family)